MRSRNGTRPLLLAVCPLILGTALWAADYRIGYRALFEDARIVREELTVSRAMTPCRGLPAETLLLENRGYSGLRPLLEEQFDNFFPLLQRLGLHLRHREELRSFTSHDRTRLTLPPRCFTVDFNEDFVRITALKTGH